MSGNISAANGARVNIGGNYEVGNQYHYHNQIDPSSQTRKTAYIKWLNDDLSQKQKKARELFDFETRVLWENMRPSIPGGYDAKMTSCKEGVELQQTRELIWAQRQTQDSINLQIFIDNITTAQIEIFENYARCLEREEAVRRQEMARQRALEEQAKAQEKIAAETRLQNSIQLWDQVSKGNIEAVKQLIAAGVDIDYMKDGWTPLLLAIDKKHSAIVKLLLESGAKIHRLDDYHFDRSKEKAPDLDELQFAIETGCAEIVGILLDTIVQRDKQPLKITRPYLLNIAIFCCFYAKYYNNEEIVALILKRNDIALNCLSTINCSCNYWVSPLLLSVLSNSSELTKQLLEKGADPNRYCSCEPQRLTSVFPKVDYHFAYSQTEYPTSISYLTPLKIAVILGNLEITRLLLHHGAVPLRKDLSADIIVDPLFDSMLRSSIEIFTLLLEFYPSVDEHYRFNDGHGLRCESLLNWTIRQGMFELSKLLLEKKALVDSEYTLNRNGYWETPTSYGYISFKTPPLITACEKGNEELVQMILNRGARLDVRLHNGKTALMVAAENGHFAIVRLLVQRGCNIRDKIPGPEHMTAAKLAAKNGHHEIASWLRTNKSCTLL